jgi:hypothetical protein
MLRAQVDTQASLLAFTTSLSSQVQLPPPTTLSFCILSQLLL